MTNTKEVTAFCHLLSNNFGARFNSGRSATGISVVGEFYTRRGELITMMLDVSRTGVRSKVYNSQRRLIYNDTTKSIMNNQALITFLQKTYAS